MLVQLTYGWSWVYLKESGLNYIIFLSGIEDREVFRFDQEFWATQWLRYNLGYYRADGVVLVVSMLGYILFGEWLRSSLAFVPWDARGVSICVWFLRDHAFRGSWAMDLYMYMWTTISFLSPLGPTGWKSRVCMDVLLDYHAGWVYNIIVDTVIRLNLKI